VRHLFKSASAIVLAIAVSHAPNPQNRSTVAERVMKLTRESSWKPVASIRIAFRTYHPQGMVKIRDEYFVSSVEVRVPTRRFTERIGGYDRDTGDGIGHLFKIDKNGQLISDTQLGDGTAYHPGGIDYDGRSIWVPVAEYRPDSRSVIYRANPEDMKAAEILRFGDHIGALAYDIDEGALHGVSWGSRRFYRWSLDRNGRITAPGGRSDSQPTMNESHYVDYQDCKYAGSRRMLCTGVTELRPPNAAVFRLGGMDLVSLADGRPIHQVPILLWTSTGMDMTHNPVWVEPSAAGLRAYFMPEDNTSTIYIYDVDAK
jgi:hypothetical protein